MILAVEIILLLSLFTGIYITGMKKHSLQGLHNLPIRIQKRVRELPQYQNKIKEPILSNRQRIIKKLPALFLVAVIFAALVYLAGARDFIHGFLYSFALSTSIKLYVTLILQCVVLANHPELWLPGTEDLEMEWKNKSFYLSSIPRSLFAFALVGVLIGAVMELL